MRILKRFFLLVIILAALGFAGACDSGSGGGGVSSQEAYTQSMLTGIWYMRGEIWLPADPAVSHGRLVWRYNIDDHGAVKSLAGARPAGTLTVHPDGRVDGRLVIAQSAGNIRIGIYWYFNMKFRPDGSLSGKVRIRQILKNGNTTVIDHWLNTKQYWTKK